MFIGLVTDASVMTRTLSTAGWIGGRPSKQHLEAPFHISKHLIVSVNVFAFTLRQLRLTAVSPVLPPSAQSYTPSNIALGIKR